MNLTLPTTPDVRLRALEPADLDLLYAWENDTALWKRGETLQPWSREVLRKFAESVQDIYTQRQLRLVVEAGDGRAVGLLDLFDFDPHHRRCGIGILIANEADRKKGLATQALKVACDYALNTLLLRQLYCDIQENNQASIALFEHVGFTHQGTRKNWVITEEGPVDVRFYQYLKAE